MKLVFFRDGIENRVGAIYSSIYEYPSVPHIDKLVQRGGVFDGFVFVFLAAFVWVLTEPTLPTHSLTHSLTSLLLFFI